MTRIKLYCWNNPMRAHFGGCGSFLVVAARTETAARRLAKDAIMLEYGMTEKDTFGKLGREAAERLGKPDYVFESPTGLVYWWHE